MRLARQLVAMHRLLSSRAMPAGEFLPSTGVAPVEEQEEQEGQEDQEQQESVTCQNAACAVARCTRFGGGGLYAGT